MRAKMRTSTFTEIKTPDAAALRLLEAGSAEKLQAVPLYIDRDGRLVVAVRDPNDHAVLEEIRMLTGCSVVACAAHEADIRRAISDFYKVAGSVEAAMQDDRYADVPILQKETFSGELSPDDAPVVRLLDDILDLSSTERASDVHIEPGEQETKVRIRVDGVLNDGFTIPRALHGALLARIKIKGRMDIAEKRKPQDGRIMIAKEGRQTDVRVSIVPTVHGEKAVMRLLDRAQGLRTLESLGFSEYGREQIEKIIRARNGICLVTGPTGSGKTTTLYALLQRLNDRRVNVVTIEDPVEYGIEGITQIQVNEKIGLTFDVLLRSVLRQDPDIIMIGEIRDGETAQLAVRAALTGHLVLATLHTNDAPSAAGRLIDMGVPDFLLASSLSGVVAQRLVRKLCPHCRSDFVPNGENLSACGCRACRMSGYIGRTVVSEVMPVDTGMRELIAASAPAHALRDYALQNGMRAIFEDAMEKVRAGETDLREVQVLEGIGA